MNTNSLQAALDRARDQEPAPIKETRPFEAGKTAATGRRQPSREGRKLVAGHFDPKVAKKLKVLAAEEDSTVQALLEEAIDLLFIKKGLPPGGRHNA